MIVGRHSGLLVLLIQLLEYVHSEMAGVAVGHGGLRSVEPLCRCTLVSCILSIVRGGLFSLSERRVCLRRIPFSGQIKLGGS